MSILAFDNVSYHYKDGSKELHILKDCSYEFQKGNFYSILGPSGSGKTTAIAIGSALDKPKKGVIKFEGKDIKKIGYTNYRKKNIAIVFQSYNLLTYMTALQNVTTAMEISGLKGDKEKAKSYLNRLGITDDEIQRPVLKLSGGQQQRVAIARALSCDVDLIFADEPTGNLDTETETEIVKVFRELAEEGKCIIVVTHSNSLAEETDIILELKNGELVERRD